MAAAFLLAASLAWTQQGSASVKRLQSPAVATGEVGGESHAGYVIHVERGRTMSVEISGQRAEGTRVEFMVSESPNFLDSAPVSFGRESDGGTGWSGRVPRTGDYYVYVVAHPVARYTLRVTVK